MLEKGKEYLVEARLTPLAKTQGFESIANLVTALKANALSSRVLRQAVVEALTTNETSFFRDIEPFEILKKNVLPELIEKRAAKKQLSLWCAASSTGQEPYTVAMLLREHFPQLVSWKISFQATDLSRDVLERARSGIFSQMEVNRGLPVTYLVKYFDKQGTQWRVKENIRSMITFSELNLIKPFSTLGEQEHAAAKHRGARGSEPHVTQEQAALLGALGVGALRGDFARRDPRGDIGHVGSATAESSAWLRARRGRW